MKQGQSLYALTASVLKGSVFFRGKVPHSSKTRALSYKTVFVYLLVAVLGTFFSPFCELMEARGP